MLFSFFATIPNSYSTLLSPTFSISLAHSGNDAVGTCGDFMSAICMQFRKHNLILIIILYIGRVGEDREKETLDFAIFFMFFPSTHSSVHYIFIISSGPANP